MQTDQKLCNRLGLDPRALEVSRGIGKTDAEGRTHVEPRELLELDDVRRAYVVIGRRETKIAERR